MLDINIHRHIDETIQKHTVSQSIEVAMITLTNIRPNWTHTSIQRE